MPKTPDTEIETLVQNIRKQLNIPCPIEDIHQVIVQLGGSVENRPFARPYTPVILKTGENSFIIVKAKDSLNDTFEMAYAIGKLCLEMHYHTKDEIWETWPINEDYRNYQFLDIKPFACELLMPKKEVIKKGNEFAEKTDDPDEILKKLAEYFHVNEILAYNRAKPLKVLRKRKK